jgi:hypothetical protein
MHLIPQDIGWRNSFLTLQGIQNELCFCGDVWLDETFYSVRADDIVLDSNNKKLRGLSKNQICIDVATDGNQSLLLVEGTGKPSASKTFELLGQHIEPGSTLFHDREQAHNVLVKALSLKSLSFYSRDLKGLPDDENPMNTVNQVHKILKHFLTSHAGFLRTDMQNYLNLFATSINPPSNLLEKVELIVDLAFLRPKRLR